MGDGETQLFFKSPLNDFMLSENNKRFCESPIYAAEFKTFFRVLSKIDNIRFSIDELKELAKGCDSFFLGVDELKDYAKKPDFILYDRFLLAVRGATMNEQEIKDQMNW